MSDKMNVEYTSVERILMEREQLRAENKRLKAAVTEIGVAHIQAQAEVARENYAVFQEQRALRAEAENERLRAALREVVTISHTSLLPDRVVEIVTAALA